MSDCGIERREQTLMGRRQDDESTAGPEQGSRSRQFPAVVFDVFEDIDIYDGVELTCFQASYRAAYDFVFAMCGATGKIRSQL